MTSDKMRGDSRVHQPLDPHGPAEADLKKYEARVRGRLGPGGRVAAVVRGAAVGMVYPRDSP